MRKSRAGTPLRDIAGQFGTSKSAVDRHRRLCIPEAVASVEEVRLELSAEAILGRLRKLERHVQGVLTEAERKKDSRLVLGAVKEARELVEAVGRLMRDVAAAKGASLDRRSPDQVHENLEQLAGVVGYVKRENLAEVVAGMSEAEYQDLLTGSRLAEARSGRRWTPSS